MTAKATDLCILSYLTVGQLEREEKERVSVEQNISRLQHEMRRLSTLISEKSGEQQRLQQDNLLMQNDFVHALKVWLNQFTNPKLGLCSLPTGV